MATIVYHYMNQDYFYLIFINLLKSFKKSYKNKIFITIYHKMNKINSRNI